MFKQTSRVKQMKQVKPTRATLKKELKEFLDQQIKNCTVMEIMEHDYKSIHDLEFPMELPESLETLLPKMSLKKYMTQKYKN
jgi:hypothetical protein